MPPRIPDQPRILRQPDETDYQYRKRRSIELYGMTPYERRKQQGLARGLSVAEARGHAPVGGKTEYQRRRESYLQRYGMSPSQAYIQNTDIWLANNGFTPERTGMSQSQLRILAPRIRWMNSVSSPSQQIYPDMLLEARDLSRTYGYDSDWTFERINEKYYDMQAYINAGDNTGGFVHFRDRDPRMPVSWWFYH